MPLLVRRFAPALLFVCSFAAAARAQQPAPLVCCTVTAPVLKVYLDCNSCDTDFVTTNVAFVDYYATGRTRTCTCS